MTPVQVNIYTESPGLAAEDVEQLLTFPVESGMAGLPKVQQIRSVSLFGLSYVAVYFEDDMDIYFARRLVMERLQEVGDRIPEGISMDFGFPPTKVPLAERLAGKKVIVLGLPGAFTPC